jgi:hypothetical protein
MRMTGHTFEFFNEPGRLPRIRGVATAADGSTKALGVAEFKKVRHIPDPCWEVTAPDGHRGMHDFRWQAEEALMWDGNGYPFPFTRKSK